MRELNDRIKNIPIPDRMRKLAIDERGFPIPRLVPYIDGKPEFRGMARWRTGLGGVEQKGRIRHYIDQAAYESCNGN